ncbi:hypothetical protein [Turicimonas sp. TL08]
MDDLDRMFDEDIHDVFLADFGKKHRIGSKNVKCHIDKASWTENMNRGIFESTLEIYVKEGEIRTPEVDETLSIDGSFHRVLAVSFEQGMLVISARENNE